MILLWIFSRIKFSQRSIHLIFFVVTPLAHKTAPWWSFFIKIGVSKGELISWKRRQNSRRNFVVSFIYKGMLLIAWLSRYQVQYWHLRVDSSVSYQVNFMPRNHSRQELSYETEYFLSRTFWEIIVQLHWRY